MYKLSILDALSQNKLLDKKFKSLILNVYKYPMIYNEIFFFFFNERTTCSIKETLDN